MKIAIITLHRVYNYGSVLQAYATQQIFERCGHQVQIIDYITPQRTLKRILSGTGNSAIGLNGKMYRVAKLGSVLLKEMTFGRFVRKNLHLTKRYITAEDIEKDVPHADCYVTGSDQTWNSRYNEGIDRGFFLDFLPDDAKRISFVASFGKNALDIEETEQTKRLLSKYAAISVREDAAVRILNNLGLAGTQLIDPTLQISRNEWLKISSGRLIKKPYLILMLLYNEDNHATEYARKIADEKNLELVKISWELKKPEMVDKLMTHRSPADFLSLFNYADFVVTNSFHGLAFSINLEKQFVVIPRNEYNSRIDSLLRLCGLTDRLVHSEEEALTQAGKVIFYENIKQVLKKERKRVDAFLDKALQIEVD